MSINTIKKEIKQHAVESQSAARFFKTGKGEYAEHDKFLGVNVPTLRSIAKEHRGLPLNDITSLLHSEYNEHRLLALYLLTDRYQTKPDEAVHLYLDHIEHVNNWNLVDSSAHLILGAYLFDKDRSLLKTFAIDDSLWIRRIAIVSTWYFIRQNDFKTTLTLSKILLKDPHDLIHKAVGWMLREVGKKDKDVLLGFLDQHAKKMPRTMLRYAIERLTPAEKKHYLA